MSFVVYKLTLAVKSQIHRFQISAAYICRTVDNVSLFSAGCIEKAVCICFHLPILKPRPFSPINHRTSSLSLSNIRSHTSTTPINSHLHKTDFVNNTIFLTPSTQGLHLPYLQTTPLNITKKILVNMPLLDRVREAVRARAERRRQAPDETDNPANESEEPSPEETPDQTFITPDDDDSSAELTSEETVTSTSTTRESSSQTHNGITQTTEQNRTTTSTSTSTLTTTVSRRRDIQPLRPVPMHRGPAPAPHNNFDDGDSSDDSDGDDATNPPSENSTSHAQPNSTTPISRARGNLRQQAHTLHRQSMNNRRRINTHNHSNVHDSSWAQLPENFGTPLERVHARTFNPLSPAQQISFPAMRSFHRRMDAHNRIINSTARSAAIERALIPTIDTETDTCAICQDPYDMEAHKSVKVPGCVHILGHACIARWLKQNPRNMRCPMCRNFVEIPFVASD